MIQITNDLWVDANKECYVVGKLGSQIIVKGGCAKENQILKSPRYFNNMSQVVKYAIEYSMRMLVASNSVETLKDFIEKQSQIAKEIEEKMGVLKA